MSVKIRTSLLEDISRLLDYLVDVGDYGGLRFLKPAYIHPFAPDAAYRDLRLKIKRLQGRIIETFLLSIDGISIDERHGLNEWLADGHSVFDNPHLLYDEHGQPLDFINGCRMEFDMRMNPYDYFDDDGVEGIEGDREDDGLPF